MTRRFEPALDMDTILHQSGRIKRVVCKTCVDVLVDDLKEGSPENERTIAAKAVAAHLEFSHGMVVIYGKCEDKTCPAMHMNAYHPEDMTPKQREAFEGLRNKT
jgi:hypothetical protein